MAALAVNPLWLLWRQGRGRATPQKHGLESPGQGQGKSKKQKLAELDDAPPKPWKPLNPAEITEGQRSLIKAHHLIMLMASHLNLLSQHCSTSAPGAPHTHLRPFRGSCPALHVTVSCRRKLYPAGFQMPLHTNSAHTLCTLGCIWRLSARMMSDKGGELCHWRRWQE